MKFIKKVSVVLVFLTMLILIISCTKNESVANVGKYDNYAYDSQTKNFSKTGLELTVNKGSEFSEIVKIKSANKEDKYAFNGLYTYDEKRNIYYTSYSRYSHEKLINEFKNKLEKSGLSAYYISALINQFPKNLMLFEQKDTLFKNTSIIAARTGDATEALESVEGIYQVTGITTVGSDGLMLLKNNSIFIKKSPKDKAYEKLVGKYILDGDFLTIQNLDKDKNPTGSESKYMMAKIVFSKQDSIVVDKNISENDKLLSKVPKEIKLRVLVTNFYKKIK